AAELREWTFQNGDVRMLSLENAYGDMAYFSDKKGNPLSGPITMFADADQAEIVYWSRQRDKAFTAGDTAPSDFTRQFRKDARRLRDGRLAREDWSEQVEPEFYGIYTSAGWCGPCRRFTPKLVQTYDLYKTIHQGRFEVLFCSSDENLGEMIEYMEKEEMAWYGNWAKRKSDYWQDYQGNGIPNLVIVDRNGYVLKSSYVGGEYTGPNEAMNELTRLLAYTNPGSGGRLSVPVPGVDMGKLRQAIREKQELALAEGSKKALSLVHNPKAMLAAMEDPDAPEVSLRMTVSISELGVVTGVRIEDDNYRHLDEQFYKATLLWQFMPAVGQNGETHNANAILPVRMKLKEALLSPPG
ncbi:MAG: hypothetical protein DRP71_16310, partial [Verrucomicrobia bacterium]